MGSDGFIWSGSLDETDIQSLYAACQSLRFSGKLELRDGGSKAEVTFVGGEPLEIDGGDTQRIALWNRGHFRAVQSIPNLSGELTGQREMEGSLAITKASQLWAWISEYRLTCDIDLERPGSKAVVSFSNGHAESAQVNGMPELAALARVSSWTDGTFRVRLKPLFLDGVIPAAPLMPESAPPAGRQFDVSRSIPMDLKPKLPPIHEVRVKPAAASFGPPRTPTPPRGGVPPRMQATPPLGELAMTAPAPRNEERTSETVPLPPPEPRGDAKRSPFDPMELSKPYLRHDQTEHVRAPRSSMLWLFSLLAIVVAAGLGALYYFHLPPFSPPPKPVETVVPPATGEAQKPVVEERQPPAVEAKPPAVEAKPPAVEAKPPVVEAKPPAVEAKPPVDAKKPAVEAKKPEVKPTDKIIGKARLLLVEGHSHTALEQIHRAMKMAPKDPSFKVFEQQAMGRLGKAEILIEGKGTLMVDWHKFPAGKKLRLMAGPHVIDAGDGEEEVTLKRGEKRRIKVKK